MKKKEISFRESQIRQSEVDILQKIEKSTKLQFTKVKELDWNTKMGFTVKKDRIIGIGLYDCGLSALPESIGNLKCLQKLDLSNNKFKILPESICNLKSLQKLNLEGNQLSNLPESIGNLKSLQMLLLGFNQLKTLPVAICNLKSLQVLLLECNKLMIIPESIILLKSLIELDLTSNYIAINSDSRSKSVLDQLEKKGVFITY